MTTRSKSLLRNLWKSRTPKPKIPLENEKSRTLNDGLIYPSILDISRFIKRFPEILSLTEVEEINGE